MCERVSNNMNLRRRDGNYIKKLIGNTTQAKYYKVSYENESCSYEGNVLIPLATASEGFIRI